MIAFSVNADGSPEVCYETPAAPMLVFPDHLGEVEKEYIELRWEEVEIATHYIVQFSDLAAFTEIQFVRDLIAFAEDLIKSVN